MAQQIFNKNYDIDVPTLVLARRDYSNIDGIKHASNIVYKENLNSPTLSFTVYKDNKWTHWEDINNYNLVYIPEYKEYFAMHVNINEENTTQKEVECIYFPQEELQNSAKIHNLEINTEEDIERTDYDADYPTIFYRDLSKYTVGSEMYKKLYHSSLLHRVMSYAPNYTIGHVDTSLMSLNTWFQYTISESNVFDVLNGEVAENYHCLFKFDSVSKTIDVYDLYNTCNTCGYRGDFHDECPDCKSKNFGGAFGEDTTIFISKENIATAASIESNKDSLKNCFYVVGGDDLMTAAIAIANPNGSNYIFNFSEEIYKNMPVDLVSKIEEYNKLYTECLNVRSYNISNDLVSKYNETVNYINHYYPIQNLDGTTKHRYETITSQLAGYKSIASLCYDCIDLSLDLKHSMGKMIQMDNLTIHETMNLLTSTKLSPIAVKSDISQVSKSVVENTIIGVCKSLINTALYKVEISTGNYNKTSHIWSGSFKLMSIEDETVTLVGNTVSISINNDMETYLKQNIQRELNKLDTNYKDLKKLDLPDEDFKSELKYYSISYLQGLLTSFNNCLGIIVDSDNEELKNQYTAWYSNHIGYIETEIGIRENYLKSVNALYDYTNQSGVIYDIQQELKTELNFELFLGKELYGVFNSYRMEDTYKNENYISDGLDNGQLITRASELIDMAKKELYKASHIQYTVNTTMNNLLVLPEFQSIVDQFAVGNWIHICVDDVIYYLRLLSYTIYFDDIPKIDVEFSTVEKIPSGTSDVDSTLKAAQNIAGSYSNDSQKIKNSQNSSKYVENWVSKGFDATANKIVNNADKQTTTYDSSGILCRSYDDLTDVYDLCQSRVLNSGFYVTDDGWKTVKSAVGKYVYLDPRDNTYKTTMGVLAQTFVGQAILGETFGIYNASGSMSFDDKGLVVRNDVNSVTINPNDNSKLFKISNKTTDCFYTDNEGNLNLTGNINGGTITLGSGKFKVDDKGNITTTGDISLANGNLVYDSNAKKLTVNGIVNASGGAIGNFTISSSGIYNGLSSIAGTVNGIYIGIDGIKNIYDNDIVTIHDGSLSFENKSNTSKMILTGSYLQFYYKNACMTQISSIGIVSSHMYVHKSMDFPVMLSNLQYENGTATYYGLVTPDGSFSDWIRTTENGIIPYYRTNGAGCSSLGTSTWNFAKSYINSMYCQDIYFFGDSTNTIYVKMDDGSNHGILSQDELTTYLGWSGSGNDGNKYTTYTVLRGKSVRLGSTSGTVVSSDERLKNSFKLLDEFDDVYMDIIPYAFRYNNGTSGRFHYGFKAQNVRDALLKHGYTTKDFGGFVQMVDSPENEDYCGINDPMGIIYSEFEAWNTHMIQKVIKENIELRQRIEKLEKAIA